MYMSHFTLTLIACNAIFDNSLQLIDKVMKHLSVTCISKKIKPTVHNNERIHSHKIVTHVINIINDI